MSTPLFPRSPQLGDRPVDAIRHDILETFHATFDRYEQLFETLACDAAWYEKAIRLRHPLIFYFGHTATFFINKVLLAGLIEERLNPEGMLVKKGDVLATVADDKLALQLTASDAQIAGAQAENAKEQEDLQRGRDLFKNGTISKAKIDDLQARADVASNQLQAQQSAKSVVLKQVEEGQVLAPADGRILTVPLTQGAFIMPGEVVARLAADHFILRLKLPERHARALKVNDAVVLDGSDLGSDKTVTAKSSKSILKLSKAA